MSNLKSKLKNITNRSYLARDFTGFRNELIEHARIFYPDKIQDFSEPGIASLLVDMAAMVGDTMSHYLDHQFRELDPSQAVEPSNIATHARNAGLEVTGASPASGECVLSFVVPAVYQEVPGSSTLQPRPKLELMPFVLSNTSFVSDDGITFNLTEDIDFSRKNTKGEFVAAYDINEVEDGIVKNFLVSLPVEVVSGDEVAESFTINDDHIPFRTITLSNPNVTEVISVEDADGNEYYEVSSLSQDTVYVQVDNLDDRDRDQVTHTLEVAAAPRRYVKSVSPANFGTTLTFGGGDSKALDDDLAPDPSDLSLSLFGKKNFTRFSIDPNSLLDTQTLGISPRNTTMTVHYRYGGGIRHNQPVGGVIEVKQVALEFRRDPIPREALGVRQSIAVINLSPLGGADNPLSPLALRGLIPLARNAQERVVTREDLLARLYTLPTKFGKLYRAGLSVNPTNNLSLVIHVVSKDAEGRLAICPDTFKMNLSKYINEYRLISDSFDIVDAKILNFQVKYEVFLSRQVNKLTTLNAINRIIARVLDRRRFTIDQPIIVDTIFNAISSMAGVVSINDLQILPVFGSAEDNTIIENLGLGPGERVYSTADFNTSSSVKGGILRGDLGSIFELRYPEHDIIGFAV